MKIIKMVFKFFQSIIKEFIFDILSTKWFMILSTCVYTITQIWIKNALGHDTGMKLLSLQTTCAIHPTPIDNGIVSRQQLLDHWTLDDVQRLERHFIIDYWIHPIIYVLNVSSVVLNEYNRRTKRSASKQLQQQKNDGIIDNNGNDYFYHQLFLVLFITAAGFSDYMENVNHYSIIDMMMQQDDDVTMSIPDQILWNGCVCSVTKWFIISICIFGVIGSWIQRLLTSSFLHDNFNKFNKRVNEVTSVCYKNNNNGNKLSQYYNT